MRAAIEALVASDKLEEAATALAGAVDDRHPDLSQEVVALQAGLTRSSKSHRRGLIDDDDFDQSRTKAGYAILGILDDLEGAVEVTAPDAISPPVDAPGGSPRVFLSYNHADSEDALGLRAALEERGVGVHIDREAMRAGEGIRSFIERSIQETDATVCLVSNRSLASAWVAMETIDAFYAELSRESRRFIACYIDDDFFQPRFRLECTERIDAKIAEIETLIPEYVEKRLDTNDLNSEKTRLYALRNNLGKILLRLKESLSLDIRGDQLGPSVERITQTLLDE